MERRRFLKYGAAGAAIAGSALAGYEFDRWQSSLVPAQTGTVRETTTQTVTQTLSKTTTETLKLSSLHGRLFFDYNGNGTQDGDEPPVVGASVQLKDDAGSVIAEAPTDSSGDYALQDVRTWSYKLHVEADKKFRYMGRSPDEFTAIPEGYDITLDRSVRMDIGLMEGFLTLPFCRGAKYEIIYYVDVGENGSPRDWQGHDRTYQRGTYRHAGTDYVMEEGNSVLAAAPGIVRWIGDDPNGGQYVWLQHVDGYYTTYSHLRKVETVEGEFIARGGRMGLSGSVPNLPHLHFEVDKPPPGETSDFSSYCVDPYRSLVPPLGSSLSLWTKDNDPQYPF